MLERYTQPAIGRSPRRFNVARGTIAAVTVGGELRELRWGLLAPWRGHGGKRPPPIHTADAASIDATPVLRRAEPCAVHADGFYAWLKVRSKRHAFWIHADDVAFAGLAAMHADDGIESFAIATAPAPPEIAHVTPIAPRLLEPATWRATEVSTYFADASHDDARCIAPLEDSPQLF